MDKAWQWYVETATELTAVTRRRAEAVVRNLVKQGEVAADRAERSVEDLLARSERNRQVLSELVTREVERTVSRLRLVRRDELDQLAARVAQLERARSADATPETPTRGTPSKQAATKKAATKKTTAKKQATKKATAKKQATKKAAGGGSGGA